MRRLFLLLALAGLAVAAGWAVRRASAPDAPARARAVVLLTIDTLRADRLNASVMPALSRFAEGGLRFEQARTTAPLTHPAHMSLMTGLLPPAHGARENGAAASPATVAAQLRAQGFRSGAFVSAFVLDRRFGLAEGFEHYDDRVARDPEAALRLEAERPGGDTVTAALAWLTSIDARRERFFLWVHLFEPHAPYNPPAGCGASGTAVDGMAAYDRDVACADAAAARLIDGVGALAGERDIAWIVAGDHGEALGEHGESTHGMLLYDATLRVPLFVRGPGTAPGSTRVPVSLVDVAPTLLAWTGVAIPSSMTGVDLRGALDADRDVYSETVYPRRAGWHGLAALSGRRWKVIESSETELYDLEADPGETRNVAAAHARIAAALGAAAARMGAAGTASAPAASAETRERLRALGYVGGGTAAPPAGTGVNPATVIASWVTFERALALLQAGRAREALPALAALASAHADGQVFQSTYARALSETGGHRAALAVHRRIVARSPGDAMAFHDLAAAARLAGDVREADRAEQAALALEPGNAAVLNGLGLAHAGAGRAREAATAFRQAVAADPGVASYWINLGNALREAGDLGEAERAYRRALEHAPGYVEGLNGLGVVLVQTGRAREAAPLFARAAAADSTHLESRLNLAIAYQESGRPEDARRAYRDVLAMAPRGSREHTAATALLAGLK